MKGELVLARKKSAKSAENKNTKQDNETVQQTETAAVSEETVSKEEYDKLKAEFDAQKDQFLRMAAEYDNFRKPDEAVSDLLRRQRN